MVLTDGKEFFFGFYAADVVLKAGWLSLGDVDEVFFHFLDVFLFHEIADDAGGFFKEEVNVAEDHALGDWWGSGVGE